MPWVDEARLDDPDALRTLDTHDSLRSLASAGAQVRRAIVSAQEAGASRAAGGERPRSVLVAALGGSSLVCDVLDLLAEPGSPVPVTTRRDAPLPGWVGPLDLVIAVSQSGRAVGPLALAAEAARRGASLLTVGRRRLPARRRLREGPWRPRRGGPAHAVLAHRPVVDAHPRARRRRRARPRGLPRPGPRARGRRARRGGGGVPPQLSRPSSTPPRSSPSASGAPCRSSSATAR